MSSFCSAVAAEKTFGPFSVDDSQPDLIVLNGEIDVGSALNFRRILEAAPQAKAVALNSPGGSVQMGLLIADDIHQRGLATYIPKQSGCYSACAYVFLAGTARLADGELGVHQISSQSADLVGAQLTISDIIDVLGRFDTPAEVMSVMFKTPPNEMHVFSAAEIERYHLDRTAEALSRETLARSTADLAMTRQGPASALSEASLPPNEAPKRPDRIAIYTGLDLFGDDIDARRVAEAGDCAQQCAIMRGQCKAFTFNVNPNIKRGPNCFLKSGYGRVDGNAVALSGMVLGGAQADPLPFTIGTIDPHEALFDDIDLPGGDLATGPERQATTPLQCRLACIDNKRCLAFTYVRARKECWLKGTTGTPRAQKGMVSGIKTPQSYTPAKIIDLD
ncbi:PAN domain-containing protein [Rhizobium halophytocola]|uniref:Apple domain-containing protein n=1 Tax=Rhizobium halophytocola TaxID=735519 RepID=A0ABS4E230_9HYPH|nr:hypothetical protein [Rhizobium halophytocola]